MINGISVTEKEIFISKDGISVQVKYLYGEWYIVRPKGEYTNIKPGSELESSLYDAVRMQENLIAEFF